MANIALLFNTIPTNPINDVNKQITPVAVTTAEEKKKKLREYVTQIEKIYIYLQFSIVLSPTRITIAR